MNKETSKPCHLQTSSNASGIVTNYSEWWFIRLHSGDKIIIPVVLSLWSFDSSFDSIFDVKLHLENEDVKVDQTNGKKYNGPIGCLNW